MRDIITEDIQKKREKIKGLEEDIHSQRENITKLKEILDGLGIQDEAKVNKYKILQKEVEQAEKNLLIFKKNWKGRIEKEKRIIETLTGQNKAMLVESREMSSVIDQQLMRLEDLRDQEERFQLMREQKKLEYQSQLEMMLLEREVMERELAYNKMVSDAGIDSGSLTPARPKAHESSYDLYEQTTKATMGSKNIGHEGLGRLVDETYIEKKGKYQRDRHADRSCPLRRHQRLPEHQRGQGHG